jgi:SAM-dependent methyltransferase
VAEANFIPQNGYKELLIGCGHSRVKRLKPADGDEQWANLVTLDFNPAVNPDVVWDLNKTPWPFDDNQFDEIHAYEVLEHLGHQGDYKSFFAHFEEVWRILKPGGYLFGSTPAWDGLWAWSDPGHTRIISEGSLMFLDQQNYEKRDEKSPMTDYRFCYRGDLTLEGMQEQADSLYFAMKARK